MRSSFWEFEAYKEAAPPALPEGVLKAANSPTANVKDVTAPGGFNVTMFGSPPDVNYPVCLTAAATGEVFVGVDEQGSLGKELGKGRVIRCIDVDGDGKADKINTFAKMDHPRGLFYDNGSLWVLHPPFLSVYHDDDRDGTADRHQTLITGISTDEVNRRGADHTTNGIRMGIDGWIYIAVGDFGFIKAEGTDGRVLSRRGGGIVRVRPDGTDMEIHNWGQRNILDVCIDPFMNVFTRDNTNDGGGWDIRVSHILQSGEYGYPSLYMNFTEESLPPLADYGGGSGCGGMFLHDLRWPKPFANAVYTCDWGRSEVYVHNLPANGPTFDAHQDVFLKIPRPTDIDVDGSGRMYVSSWKNGKFAYGGPNVGFVAQVTPIDFTPNPFPDLNKATDAQLVGHLSSPSAVYRQHSQLEILRRGPSKERTTALTKTASDKNIPLYGRVAALWTLKQLLGAASTDALLTLAQDDEIREFALRALTDRKSELKGVPTEPFLAALKDTNPRVRAQALICLGRLGRQETAEAIIPLTARESQYAVPTQEPLYKQADPGRVIPHLAVRALVAVDGAEAALKAVAGKYSAGALWALKYMHNKTAVKGLITLLSTERDTAKRNEIMTTLIRLYHQEGEYKSGWWGTRPDRTGPYYDRQPWSQSETIAKALATSLADADKATVAHAATQLARHKVELKGLPTVAQAEARTKPEKPIVIPSVDPNNPNQVANMKFEAAADRAFKTNGDVAKGKALFTQQSCLACHTFANGQTPKGPHLVDIGKRYKKNELIESILKPSAKIAQGFDTYSIIMHDGKIFTGFVTTESALEVKLKQTTGVALTIKKSEIDERVKQKLSMMPIGLANNLTPEQVADLVAYLQSLK
jgi:putative membrane-bound dehydrogenase-like protein